MFAGDRDRERAAASLKEHYVDGRLTLDELGERTELVLAARSRADLRRALRGLPWTQELLAAQGRSMVQSAARGALLVVLTGAWLMFSLALMLVFALTMLFQGASGTAVLGFLVVWLVPTYLLSRVYRRQPTRRPSV